MRCQQAAFGRALSLTIHFQLFLSKKMHFLVFDSGFSEGFPAIKNFCNHSMIFLRNETKREHGFVVGRMDPSHHRLILCKLLFLERMDRAVSCSRRQSSKPSNF